MRWAREVLLACAALAFLSAGCVSDTGGQRTGTDTNTTPVSLLMTGEPVEGGISVLSFEVILTSAMLNPGNRQLLSAPVTVEVTRLQAETTLLSDADITPGTYTSADLTFAGPSLTFQNNTAANLSIWGSAPCPPGAICTAAPALPANVKLAGTINLPGSGVTLTKGTPAALLLDLDLSNMLLNTVQADLPGNSTIARIVPAAPEDPFAMLEDVVGTVSAKNSTLSNFTLQTVQGPYSVRIIAGASPTMFRNFPPSVCGSATFACVQTGQIVAVNMSLQPDGTLLASDVLFEDADSTAPEIEGIVVAATGGSPPVQFRLVVLRETPDVPGIAIGDVVDVAPAPAATFDVDNLGADTSAFSFTSSADLMVGQQVQVRRLSTSTATQLDTDRVRLRPSRFTANVSNPPVPYFTVNDLPPLFAAGGISQIQVYTSPLFTEFFGTATNVTQIVVNNSVTIRAQLFANGPTSAAVATKVIQH